MNHYEDLVAQSTISFANNLDVLSDSSDYKTLTKNLQSIFFVTGKSNNLVYINQAGLNWLGTISYKTAKHVDLNTYFEEEVYLQDRIDSNSNIYLRRVWFPEDDEHKLCLVSRLVKGKEHIQTIVPLKDWSYFKHRLANLVAEEQFAQDKRAKYNELTNRERQIVSLIYEGYNSRQISERLCISKHTVEQHRKNINRKLNISSVAELVEYGRVFNY